jgi:endonuclease/exonuclease/phosphatase family metal-dependent hydrolase
MMTSRKGAVQKSPKSPPLEIRDIVREMSRFRTLSALRRSAFWRLHGPEVLRLLRTVQQGAPARGTAVTAPAKTLRIVHWNIERGKEFEAILENLREHPELRDADLVLLNEVDVGMARSGNRHTARELGEALGLYWAFSPSYLELTKGLREEALVPGENRESLHGLALLSRIRPERVERVELPEIFDTFDFAEKRFGARSALLASFGAPWAHLFVATTHLEVRDTPTGRRRQMEALLRAIEDTLRSLGSLACPVLVAGDFNTHTFARGNVVRNARAVGRVLGTPLEQLAQELVEPWRRGREPLFQALEAFGYEYASLNDRSPTVSVLLRGVEETDALPLFLRRWITRAASLGERVLPMRLDWFAGRHLLASPEGGMGPWRVARAATVLPRAVRGRIPSDHLPLVLDLERADAEEPTSTS